MKTRPAFAACVAFLVWAMAAVASAAPIIGAVSATINTGGPGGGSIDNTFNQNGLSAGYTSGVTDFDVYLAGDPSHTIFTSGEWSSALGSSASVTYDLGSVQAIDAVALWNEEGSGIGLLSLFFSADGVSFAPLALGLVPTDTVTLGLSYSAQVFSFPSVNAQYIRFDMSDCPQEPSSFAACAIGEVAFRRGAPSLPEPHALAFIGVSVAGVLLRRRIRAA